LAQEEAENAKTGDIGEMLNQLKNQKKDADQKLSVTDAVKMADEASRNLEKANRAEDEKNVQLADQIGILNPVTGTIGEQAVQLASARRGAIWEI